VEQTPEVHRLLETHEVIGIVLALIYLALAGWRLWRRNRFSVPEQQSYTMTSVVAALALLWTAHLGGTMVFEHAAGIPTRVLEAEIEARAADTGRADHR